MLCWQWSHKLVLAMMVMFRVRDSIQQSECRGPKMVLVTVVVPWSLKLVRAIVMIFRTRDSVCTAESAGATNWCRL